MILNQDSMQRINNILTGLRTPPSYVKYDVQSFIYPYFYYINSYAHAIQLMHNGQTINLFLFFPGNNGEISSIAIYGTALKGHFEAIKSSMKIFEMEVNDIQIDNEGLSPYVDVYLKPYKPL